MTKLFIVIDDKNPIQGWSDSESFRKVREAYGTPKVQEKFTLESRVDCDDVS